MKKAMVVIRPNTYKKTKAALEQAGFYAISSTNVAGRGKRPISMLAADGSLKSAHEEHRFIVKKMIMVYIRDEDEKLFVDTVMTANQTGHPGDGKIFMIPVKNGIRIRTGEHSTDALY